MRTLLFAAVVLLAVFTLTTSAATHWDKDDHEIFELQSALENAEGAGATFYSVLDIARSSSALEIKRAYRKKSLELHPDKNAGVPGAQQRFERLGLVYKILRDGRKDRYDHFLTKGFPKWRNNGYFYQRYRPGLGAVVVGVVLFTIAVELVVSRLTSSQERAKIERLKMSARLVAWGPRYQAILAAQLYPSSSDTTPALPNSKLPQTEKKVRVPITGFPTLPAFPSASAIQSNSVDWDHQESLARSVLTNPSSTSAAHGAPIVECTVHETDVLLYDKFSGQWVPLDEEDAKPSQWHQTWPFRLAAAVVNKFTHNHEDVLAEPADDDHQAEQQRSDGHKANGAKAAKYTAGKKAAKKNK